LIAFRPDGVGAPRASQGESCSATIDLGGVCALTDGEASTRSATPELIRPERGDARARRSGIRDWVQSLPLANVGQTAHMLYERLGYLNTRQIPQADRYAILEALRPALDLVLQSLGRHYLQLDLPLAGRGELVARLSRELQRMMVSGYRLVLMQLHGASPLTRAFHNGRCGEVLHRQLYYLGRLLLEDFQLYHRHPKGLWQDIHAVHLEALRLELQDRPYESEDSQFPGRSSIADLYKQLLLLGLSGPYRLLQGEAQRVYHALYGWAPLARLLPLGDAQSGSALYLVEPESDCPPRYREETAPGDLRGWVLDTGRLADVLGRELESLGGSAPPSGALRPEGWLVSLSPELIGRLTLAWGLGGTRSATRHLADGELSLIYGIDSIISVLLTGAELRPPPGRTGEPPSGRDGRGGRRQDTQTAGLRVDDLSVEEDIALLGGDEAPAPWSRAQQEGPGPIDVCRVVDRSPQGFHVRLTSRGERPRRVGDLVAVAERSARSEGHPWRVGVIRWMRANAVDDIRLGVEILSEWAEPVVLHWRRREGGEEQRMPSLLIGEPDDAGGVVDLVTPAFFPAPSDRLELRRGARIQGVRVLQPVERTRSFVHCRYTGALAARSARVSSAPAPAPPSASVNKPAAPAEEDDFDTLWRNL